MIPADSIILDGATALMVTGYVPVLEDRPCDHCQPTTSRKYPRHHPDHCPDCDGTGRHTFTVEVEVERCSYGSMTAFRECGIPECWYEPCRADGKVALTVHVIDVLPIVSDYDESGPFPLIVQDEDLLFYLVTTEDEAAGSDGTPITLPSATEPGQWLVRLAVHDKLTK